MGLDHACIVHFHGVLHDCNCVVVCINCVNYIHGRMYLGKD